ncbi:MAG: hypothetical protein U1C57_00015 [Candidatus Doudnabacteria bacterium]|nr:hypothetical protein [Candidatus Doudnabacteria bacterium]
MKKGQGIFSILILLFLVVAAKAEDCKEWAFHFPTQEQLESPFLLTQEALSNPANIRQEGDFAAWLEQARPQILASASGLAGQKLGAFTVRRDMTSNQACLDYAPFEETLVPADSPGTGISKKRRILTMSLEALPLGLSFVGVPAAMFGGFGAQILSGVFFNRGTNNAVGNNRPQNKTDSTFRLEGEWWNELW